jgi:hypothetical protein
LGHIGSVIRVAVLATLFLESTLTSQVAAQAAGQVVDATGQPIESALVELWSPTKRLAGTLTDANGRFSFSSAHSSGTTAILVRRIGFSPQRVRWVPDLKSLVIQMLPFPVRLAPVVGAQQRLCPNEEHPEARLLWSSVMTRYRRTAGTSYWADVSLLFSRVRTSDLGAVDSTLIDRGLVGYGRRYHEMQTQLIWDSGYAVPMQGLKERRFDLWRYPLLHAFLADHFVDAVFGDFHVLSVAGQVDGVTTLVFCPIDRERPEIEGTLTIADDSTLAAASWRFLTPEPHEEAGGQVAYAARAGPNGQTPLFPMSGLYWRKLVFDYYQEWMEYREWHNCADEPNDRLCP